jgi:hypothetical protein
MTSLLTEGSFCFLFQTVGHEHDNMLIAWYMTDCAIVKLLTGTAMQG